MSLLLNKLRLAEFREKPEIRERCERLFFSAKRVQAKAFSWEGVKIQQRIIGTIAE